ncbi:MAG: hypothetical protein DLM58_11930 [Pseudonocardiales bacterium]|nr:MAG: hypothetical protein DLM58_11930 [Pseudonocardiales bacterium]
MRVRKSTAAVGLIAALALVMGGLSGCDSKVGQAAIVGGHRISESDLSKYLTPTGPSPSVLAAASKANQGVYPKTEVIQILVQQKLFELTLAKNGGVPTDGELASLHDQAAATFLGTQLKGAAFDSYLKSVEGNYGYGSQYAQALLRTIELEAALVVKIKAQSIQDVAAAVNKLNITVQINPRYGKWSPENLSIGAPSATLPSFIKISGISSPSAQVSTSGTP